MAKKTYEYLDELGLQNIAKGILNQVNSRITERIVTTVDANSDDAHVASAAAVYKAIAGSQHTKIKVITGDIDVLVPLEERDPTVMYYQRDNEDDKTWMIYIWDVDNQQWINVGDTEIDLSNYWSKDDTDELREVLGIVTIENNVTEIQGDVSEIKEDIININTELAEKVNKSDLGPIAEATVRAILNAAYEETDPFKYEEVRSVDAANAAIAAAVESGETEVAVRLVEDVDLAAGTSIDIPSGVEATVCLDQNVSVSCVSGAFNVANGATLNLVGRGTITTNTKKTNAAINVDAGGTLNINGVTIDACPDDASDSWCYGVYAKNSSTINFESGYIKAGASAIGTNNTTGGSTINVSGGELYSVNNYAIYQPAQGEVNITGGIVQGIVARMGTIHISGDAQIIATNLDDSNSVSIGANITTSGSLELGDTITLIAGSYDDPNGIDFDVNISGNAVVDSEFRSAIGVYMLDTKKAANVNITVANGENVTTSDAEFEAIKVYDHDYISASATAAGKTYNPAATSSVEISVDGSQVYPAE